MKNGVLTLWMVSSKQQDTSEERPQKLEERRKKKDENAMSNEICKCGHSKTEHFDL